jgi:hypothetical protein
MAARQYLLQAHVWANSRELAVHVQKQLLRHLDLLISGPISGPTSGPRHLAANCKLLLAVGWLDRYVERPMSQLKGLACTSLVESHPQTRTRLLPDSHGRWHPQEPPGFPSCVPLCVSPKYSFGLEVARLEYKTSHQYQNTVPLAKIWHSVSRHIRRRQGWKVAGK